MSTTRDNSKAEGRVLLPNTIIPNRYDIRVSPDLEAFTFAGEVRIELDTTAADGTSNEISMHAKELCFKSASIAVDGAVIDAEEIRDNKKATVVTFVFPSAVPASSKVILTVHYIGFLNNQMAGFYRSTYTNVLGESKIMASTQFESLDARRAFPCWDEPARKAVFGITFVIPAHLHAMSNMPEQSCATCGGGTLKQITYIDTPRMSTYLVAFCIGEFDYLQTLTNNGVLLRVYTPPGKSQSGAFALECGRKALDAYDQFFGVPYPLPKLDMVAIPEFAMGAMENWGLVTYRQVDLLIDPDRASNTQKQRVCTVVTHELAHQWFGNLVTMAWWDDLWLNEGFASWAQNWAADQIFPEWTMWDQFTTGALSGALKLDSLRSSHPIQVPIRHAEEVEEVFDMISYSKGGSVVRMIRAVLGPKAFQTGLVAYMKTFAYGNTETYDLWKAWEKSSGMPVQEMMASWTEQMGFPFLTITNETWEEDNVTLELEQQWFLSDGSQPEEEEKDKKWCIPIITCNESGTQSDIIFMREKTATITVPCNNEKNGWVKLNAGQEILMRVLPTQVMLERLSIGIQNKTLPVCDRAGVLTDAYAFIKAGHLQPEQAMKLLSSYTDEDSYIVWRGINDVLNSLYWIMRENDNMCTHFVKFAQKLVLPLAKTLDWEAQTTDGHLTGMHRSLMIGLLTTFCHDDPDTVSEAKRRFQRFLADPTDPNSLPSNVKGSVFNIVLKNGDETEYNQVKHYFGIASDDAERKFVLSSLGSTPSQALQQKTLEWAISGDVKIQDFFYPMGSVGNSSKDGREIAWTFFQDNLTTIQRMIGKGSPSLMDACIMSCAGGFCSLEKANEIETFFRSHPMTNNTRRISQLVEGMRSNAQFLERLNTSQLSKDEFWNSL